MTRKNQEKNLNFNLVTFDTTDELYKFGCNHKTKKIRKACMLLSIVDNSTVDGSAEKRARKF